MLNIMSTRMKPRDPMTELREAFKVFDKEGKGYIESSNFRRIMTSMGEVMSPDEIDELIKEADKDGDGKINYEGKSSINDSLFRHVPPLVHIIPASYYIYRLQSVKIQYGQCMDE